jgi:Bacteriophage HK97-gp10, putative tail-component
MAKSSGLLVWDGLAELRAEILKLPEELTGEAAKLVEGAANAAYQDIKAAYPVRTGTLRSRTSVSPLRGTGQFVTGAVVKNTAPHAILFELGTQARHTKIGANRGSMPPGRVFVPRVLKHRRRLTETLKAMVAAHGAVVTGE